MELQGCCRLSYRLKCKLDIVTCAFLRFILLLYSSSPSFWNLLRTVSGGLWWPHQQLPSYSSLDGLAPLRIFCFVFQLIIKRVLSDVLPFIKQDITNFLFWNEVPGDTGGLAPLPLLCLPPHHQLCTFLLIRFPFWSTSPLICELDQIMTTFPFPTLDLQRDWKCLNILGLAG